MSNVITIQLCEEDRARLDRLSEALERTTCDSCVRTAIEVMHSGIAKECATLDDVQERLTNAINKAAETINKSPVNAPGAEEALTPTNTPTAEEKPTGEKTAPSPTPKTRADIKNKFIELTSKGKKAEARAIILPYGSTIKELPEDKCGEIYEKLVALEG